MTTRFAVVHDEPHPCAYRPGQTARLPLLLPDERLTPEEVDLLLDGGARRAGPTWYRPACPACDACEAIRIPIARFRPSKSQRRIARQNEAEVRVRVGALRPTARHVDIFNRHKRERGLSVGDDDLDLASLRRYYAGSGVDTREVAYEVGGELVAFSVVDLGREGVSSVYHAFDPAHARRSLGVHSVLAEVDLFGRLGFRWYYLGLYVADCRSLAYKARYFPHEKRVNGEWRGFDRAPGGSAA